MCNICSKIDNLTVDHVPPKFSNNKTAKHYQVAFGLYKKPHQSREYPLKVQNGVAYRSICARCNNQILGIELDTTYKKFVDNIVSMFTLSPDMFHKKQFQVRINRLTRAVLGHLLAAKNFYDDRCTVDKKLRKYVLNTSAQLKGFKLYCFLYPYETTLVVRDMVLLQASQRIFAFSVPVGMISCLYSFPIAFILTDEKEKLPFVDLLSFCTVSIDDERIINLSLSDLYFPGTRTLRDPFWPCNIVDNIYGSNGVMGGLAANGWIQAIDSKKA